MGTKRASAAETAVAVAARVGAEVHPVYVLQLGRYPAEFDAEGTDDLARRGDRATVEAAETGVDATPAVVESDGRTHRAILDGADRHDADCIAVGTYGRSGVDRLVLGSVAERTLRESPVPVLAVRAGATADADVESVVVPTDGSEQARAAAERAVELAATTGATLHAVNVVDVGVTGAAFDSAPVLDSLEAAGERAVDAVRDRAEATGVAAVETAVPRGTPSEAVVRYAADHDADRIVMGTHGRTGLDRLVLGSVTERVVRHSEVPVLAVPGPETAD